MDRNEIVNNANEWFGEDNENRAIICIATDKGKVSATVKGDKKVVAKMLLNAMMASQEFVEASKLAHYNYQVQNISKKLRQWTDKN